MSQRKEYIRSAERVFIYLDTWTHLRFAWLECSTFHGWPRVGGSPLPSAKLLESIAQLCIFTRAPFALLYAAVESHPAFSTVLVRSAGNNGRDRTPVSGLS